MMLIRTIALWNRVGEVRRIDLHPGFNIITGASETGKSTLIDIIRYCLGSDELKVPAGPIADTAHYYGLLVEVGGSKAFLGRPSLAYGQQSTSHAQLELGLGELPAFESLVANTTSEAVQEWLARQVGIEENRFDPPAGALRPPLVAKLPHALIYCFQRQEEIASRPQLFHHQADSFIAQAIRDTLPYFLGVTGPEQLRQAAELRRLQRALGEIGRDITKAERIDEDGLDEAQALLAQAADAGLRTTGEPPQELAAALAALTEVRDSPLPASPRQPPGEEFDRLQERRRELTIELRELRHQRALAAAVEQSGEAATRESVEQVGRLQSLQLLPTAVDVALCPVCEHELDAPLPAVDQLQAAVDQLESQIAAVALDRPGLIAVDEELAAAERAVVEQLDANRAALDALAAGAQEVAAHQNRLDLGAWVRGRIDHFLEQARAANPEVIETLRREELRLQARIVELEAELDPDVIRENATSALVTVGRRMTDMATQLGLEHSEHGVRVDLGKLTVRADSPRGAIYMATGMGSAKNFVGYHLVTSLALQEFFVTRNRPVPSFLVLDQPTQAFFPSQRPQEEIDDADLRDALAQFQLVNDTVAGLEGALQVLVLDHADFDAEWFQTAIVERWRDGLALVPQSWIDQLDKQD